MHENKSALNSRYKKFHLRYISINFHSNNTDIPKADFLFLYYHSVRGLASAVWKSCVHSPESERLGIRIWDVLRALAFELVINDVLPL